MNKTHQEKFNELYSQAERLIRNPGLVTPPGGLTDPLKFFQDLKALNVELERQNKQLHRSQQELMASKICYTELYDSLPVGYLSHDPKGLILSANLTLADMLSVKRPFLLNQQLMDYIFVEDQYIYSSHLQNLEALKTRQVCELRMKKKNGSLFDAQLESDKFDCRCKDQEQYRTAVIDISERKRAEKEKKILQTKLHRAHKIESIATIAGGIAHDINNILYIIMGNAELALDEVPQINSANARLKRIKSAALNAADIVKQFIASNRKTNSYLKPVDVVGVINEALEALKPSIPATIEIVRHFPDKDVKIFADQAQIDQIVKNLCTNSIQAMERTKGVLELKVETVSFTREDIVDNFGLSPGEYVKMTFRDTGLGIHPKIIDQIFDPYFTTRGFANGSGMGLFTVHNSVKNHNGYIDVDSQPGKGTVFTLLFSLIVENPVVEFSHKDKVPGKRKTILFVDDEESITKMMQTILEKIGYRVIATLNPLDALHWFQADPFSFDLVISDMSMPQMSGAKLVEKIMNIRSDIPIIICTGHSCEMDEEKAKQLGISDYVLKPISMSEIVERIRKVLDKEAPPLKIKAG